MENETSKSHFHSADCSDNQTDRRSSWVTDDASSILASELEAYRVSDELFEAYRLHRLYNQVIYKSVVEVIPGDVKTQEQSLTSLRVDPTIKKKKKRNKSTYLDNPCDVPDFIMNLVVNLQGETNNVVNENFKDPVQEAVKEAAKEEARKNATTPTPRSREESVKSADVPQTVKTKRRHNFDSKKNNILRFYTTSHKIEDMNTYIKHKRPSDGKWKRGVRINE